MARRPKEVVPPSKWPTVERKPFHALKGYASKVSRITERFVYVMDNDVSETRYFRNVEPRGILTRGYEPGRHELCPTRVTCSSLDALEGWLVLNVERTSDGRPRCWDSGWRPKRR